jgi:hypothetical protein
MSGDEMLQQVPTISLFPDHKLSAATKNYFGGVTDCSWE